MSCCSEAPPCQMRLNEPKPHRVQIKATGAVIAGMDSTSRSQQRQAGGVAVQEALIADRAELACGEEACDGNIAEAIADDGQIVIGLAEEPLASAVAREQQRCKWRRGMHHLCVKQQLQI